MNKTEPNGENKLQTNLVHFTFGQNVFNRIFSNNTEKQQFSLCAYIHGSLTNKVFISVKKHNGDIINFEVLLS